MTSRQTYAADTYVELVLRAELEELRRIGSWLETEIPQILEQAGCGELAATLAHIELAVCEIATNCIVHSVSAEPVIRLRGRVKDTQCEIEISGIADIVSADVLDKPDPVEPQVGGYGLMIVRQLTSSLSYRHVRGRNVWLLTFE